jgi:hypothetical protein
VMNITLAQRSVQVRLALFLSTLLVVAAPARASSMPTPADDGIDAAPEASQGNQEPQRSLGWEKAGVTIVPFGVLVANVNFNSSSLAPGSMGFFALPHASGPSINQQQFVISAGNTFVGVDVSGAKAGEWEVAGRFAFGLRGTTPVIANNVFAPYFADVYVQAKTARQRILAGQTSDILSPLFPRTLNLYPGSTTPGNMGGHRPQVMYELKTPFGDGYSVIVQGAIATAIQTYQVSEEAIGLGAGVPDGVWRIALGHGQAARRFEAGFAGHVGKRRDIATADLSQHDYDTWSANLDLTAPLGGKARVEGEFFVGSVLGDYGAGILHTFNPIRRIPVHARGGWVGLQYEASPKWSFAGGYGRDRTNDDDLSLGFRSLNDMSFGNAFYSLTPRFQIAWELSYWRTDWVVLPAGRAARAESSFIFKF